MGLDTPPSQRSNGRIVIGAAMIIFAAYRAFALLRDLPGMLQRGDSTELLVYGGVPVLIVLVFLFVGVRVVRQGLGSEKVKREE